MSTAFGKLVITFSALSALILTCGPDSEKPTSTPILPSAATEISAPVGGPNVEVDEEIFDFKFRSVTIARGTILRWVNQDPFPHTVTSGTPEETTDIWDSGQLATGEDFAHTFGEVGTHEFYCAIHPYMKATVTVAE
jgi:plastocyanin